MPDSARSHVVYGLEPLPIDQSELLEGENAERNMCTIFSLQVDQNFALLTSYFGMRLRVIAQIWPLPACRNEIVGFLEPRPSENVHISTAWLNITMIWKLQGAKGLSGGVASVFFSG